MSNETVFVNGLILKQPHQNAPDFVKLRLSFKVEDMIAFLREHDNDGWVNADIKESKGGKLYAQLDTWKPKQDQQPQPDSGGGSDASVDPDEIF